MYKVIYGDTGDVITCSERIAQKAFDVGVKTGRCVVILCRETTADKWEIVSEHI